VKVVILAGGLGTRLAEETVIRPKPMVEIGGYPILWHIMKIYANAGFREFVVALGYKGEIVKDYFLNFLTRSSDLTIDLKDGVVALSGRKAPDWRVHLVDTGSGTQTGGRVLRLKNFLDDDPSFMLTYGDGVARIDIQDLLRYHETHGRVATMTAVRPPARFGTLNIGPDGMVQDFREKPQVSAGWINGGFFVFGREIFEYLEDDSAVLEHRLEAVASKGQLAAYALEDFWQPMDTLREKHLLDELWASGNAPWKTWDAD
jgi:glucose-1-phosphate cytidylyltransferase